VFVVLSRFCTWRYKKTGKMVSTPKAAALAGLPTARRLNISSITNTARVQADGGVTMPSTPRSGIFVAGATGVIGQPRQASGARPQPSSGARAGGWEKSPRSRRSAARGLVREAFDRAALRPRRDRAEAEVVSHQ